MTAIVRILTFTLVTPVLLAGSSLINPSIQPSLFAHTNLTAKSTKSEKVTRLDRGETNPSTLPSTNPSTNPSTFPSTDPQRITDPDAARAIFEELERRQNSITREKASMNMVITDSRGRTRTRSMVMWSSFEEQSERSLTVFDDPANVRGTAFLSVRVDAIRTQKLYLPAVGRIQTITSAQRGDRFMGSDFTYEDLGDQNADEYAFLWLENHPDHYRIRASKPDSDQYSSLEFRIDRETYALREIFYFDDADESNGASNTNGAYRANDINGTDYANGTQETNPTGKNQSIESKSEPSNAVKHLVAEDFRPITDIYVAPFRMTMFDLRENRNTVITWAERDTRAEVPEWRFTDRGLRRGL